MESSLQKVGRRTSAVRIILGAWAAGACLLASGCSDDDGFGIINPDAGYRPTPSSSDAPAADAGPGATRDAADDNTTSEPSSTDEPSEGAADTDAGGRTATTAPRSVTSETGTLVITEDTSTKGETSTAATSGHETSGLASSSDESTTRPNVTSTGGVESETSTLTSDLDTPTGPPSDTDAAVTEGGETSVGAGGTAGGASEAAATSAASSGPTGVGFTLGTWASDAGVDAGPSHEDDASVDASISDASATTQRTDASATVDASAAEDASAATDASSDTGAAIHVATLEELTDQSASNYADNEHGLIDGVRLQQWLTNWELQRPAAIDGRLIILQVVPAGVTTEVHVSANEASGVYTYLVPASEFNAPRSSGLSAFESDIPAGEAADAWLAKYAIDPRHDFILLTFEDQPSTSSSIVHSVGRAWVFLKYWGVAKEHIGILNGSVDWNGTNAGVALSLAVDQDYSAPPWDGTVTVRDLGVDATVLSISLEEIIAILHEEPDAPDVEGVRIIDARGGAEALGLKKATSTGRTDCASYTGSSPNAKCSTPFEGRIKGAHSVPWTQFLDSKANGFRFLSRDQVKTIFDEQAAWDAAAEWSIHYCRTNQRSTVTGIVANVILGYPTRFYETSFIEWGHASTPPGTVASDFPFRTDLPTLTEHAVLHPDDAAAYTPGGTLGPLSRAVTWVAGPNYNEADDVSPATVEPWPTNEAGWPKLDANATTTRLAIDTDRAYLRGISIEDLD